jgi:uncharacterized Zn-finger protein
MDKQYWKEVSEEKVELDAPFECPGCNGHVRLDLTYFEQVNEWTHCPYCGARLYWPETKEHIHPLWRVEVSRTAYATKTMIIRAESKEQAVEIALELAPNEYFITHSSDYSIIAPPRTVTE